MEPEFIRALDRLGPAPFLTRSAPDLGVNRGLLRRLFARVPSQHGTHLRLDLADPVTRYGAEYDGREFHGPEQAEHDEARRAWLRSQGWTIDVFRSEDLYHRSDVWGRLAAGHRRALRRTQGCAA